MRSVIICFAMCLIALPVSSMRCDADKVPEQPGMNVEMVASSADDAVESTEDAVAASVVNSYVDDEGADSKDKKKKKKKEKKKDKEVKSPEEILAMIKALEWTKPPLTGTKIDEYYSTADEFFKNLKQVDEDVHIFKVCKITSPSGESTIAPVELRTGAVRHKSEAVNQVTQSVTYGSTVALQSATLATMTIGYADQIAKDAIPFVGDPDRKKANVQIAKSVKAFKLLKNLIDSQRNMMDRYFKANANVETTDSVSEAIAVGDVDFMDVMEMSDEELAAYMEAEENASK